MCHYCFLDKLTYLEIMYVGDKCPLVQQKVYDSERLILTKKLQLNFLLLVSTNFP